MKTITEMAREAGLESEGYWEFDLIRFKRFAELVRADEREATAKFFEGKRGQADLRDIAAAIRARGTHDQRRSTTDVP